ncbi:MAG: hypothetical protein JOZ62_19480 [Acidobacteriaceae bacterium]|nr:hypothetical protein [Acidobacteriaceae bacterium]
MRILSRLVIACAVLGCWAAGLHATSFDFSYTGPGVTASGVLTATSIGGSRYMVTDMSGTRNGAVITGIVPGAGTYNGEFIYDNLISTAPPIVDAEGILFRVQGLPDAVNICYGQDAASDCEFNGMLAYTEVTSDGHGNTEAIPLTSFSVSLLAVPEPGIGASILVGWTALLLIRRQRRPGDSRCTKLQ